MGEGIDSGSKNSFLARWLQKRSRAIAEARREMPTDRPYFSGAAPFILLLVLGLVGTFATGFLTYRHILLVSETASVGDSVLCRAEGWISCDEVLLTDYATLFGFVSSAVLGLMGFAFVLWCTVNGAVNHRMRKLAWVLLAAYFFASIGFSWYFIYLMIFVVSHLCTWCLVVHAVNIISFIAIIWVSVGKKKEFLYREIATLGERIYFIAGGILLCLLIFFGGDVWEKQLSLEKARAKYAQLAEDPVVMIARMKASPAYEIPISDRDPQFGTPTAPFPIILFSDFECPICLRTEQFLLRLVSLNPGLLKLVYKSYPLSTECNRTLAKNLHPLGCRAARAAYAAFLIGGAAVFQDYGHLIFLNQARLNDSAWLEFARELKLDPNRFEELLRSDSIAAEKVQEDVALGIALDLVSTPHIYFEKKKLPDEVKPELVIAMLEDLIHTNHPGKKDLKLRWQ